MTSKLAFVPRFVFYVVDDRKHHRVTENVRFTDVLSKEVFDLQIAYVHVAAPSYTMSSLLKGNASMQLFGFKLNTERPGNFIAMFFANR